MRNIKIDKEIYQKIIENIKTSLIYSNIEILRYYKKESFEYLEINFKSTTNDNILIYKYHKKTNELQLIDSKIGAIELEKMNGYNELVDKQIIKRIFSYCKKQVNLYLENINMEKIYNMIIDSIPLTKNNLINNGYTEEEINLLVDHNLLVELESKEYTIKEVEKLYRYGIKLLLSKKAKNAIICFNKCLELDPTNREVCLQILYGYLRLGNYNYVFEMFSHLQKITTNKKINDNNLYLYILNKLTTCPEEYQDTLTNLQINDVLIPHASKSTQPENNIRLSIMHGKYSYAMKQLNDIMATEMLYNIEHTILKELLTHLLNAETRFQQKLLHIAKTKQYGIIIMFLDEKSKKRNLNTREKSTYLITMDLLDIIKTKIIPPIDLTETDSIYEAIERRNYKLAKKLNEEFEIKYGKNQEQNIVHILLDDINELIERITKNKTAPILTQSFNELPEELSETIKYAEDLAYYINSEKMSLEEATQTYHLNQEQILLIKLIYARDWYIDGIYDKGDWLLKEVELSNHNSSRVINLLNEIKTNRVIYANQIIINKKQRILN